MRLPFLVDGFACARVAIMLIPSYTAAALTGEMVWTILTLAAASALAAVPESGPRSRQGQWTRVTSTTQALTTTLTAAATPNERRPEFLRGLDGELSRPIRSVLLGRAAA